jgi:DNA-binding CsgD family transcriptional regulator
MEATVTEVSDVIRLVREVCDLWDDPKAWREHLLHGACRLFNGHVGMMLADYASEAGWFGDMTVIAVVGLPPQLEARVQPAMCTLNQRQVADVAENELSALTSLQDDISRQGWTTTAMSQICDEATYHASPWYLKVRKPLDCDDLLASIRILDVPRRPELIGIDRPHGAPPFGPREIALMKLLHDEIAPLVGVRLATEEHLCRDGLSKRLRETLNLLLEGQSEKQVASSLGLGQRTVHDYVSRLYEHFRVSSRPELLAYFIRRTPTPREFAVTVRT